MLNSILGVLDSARKALSSNASLIRQVVAPLDRIDPKLAARAASYLADGSEATVLAELAQHVARAGELLGHPGRLHSYFWVYNQDKATRAGIDSAMAARHTLYGRIEATPADLALLERLGRLFEAADGGMSLERAGSKAPDWLSYVLNDAFWAAAPHTNKQEEDAAKLLAARSAWDIRLLRALLAEAGLAQALALPIVFERGGQKGVHRHDIYRPLLAAGALDEDMLAHADEVDALAGSLAGDGKIVLAARIAGAPALHGRFARLLVRLACSDTKTVRVEATRHLEALDQALALAELTTLLREGKGEERGHAAVHLARMQGAAAGAVLEDALARETSKPVQEAIRNALSRLEAAGDAADIALPEPPPLPELAETRLAADVIDILLANHAQLLERHRQDAEREEEANRTAKHKTRWKTEGYARFRKIGTGQLRDALAALNGEGDLKILGDFDIGQILALNGRLEARADFGLLQALRWELGTRHNKDWIWFGPRLQNWLRRQDPSQLDLRQLDAAATRCGAEPGLFARTCLYQNWRGQALPQAMLPPERVWPLLIGFAEPIDEALGMTPTRQGRYYQPPVEQALSALETFPTVPARWLPRVMELALGETRSYRQGAQRVLGKLPDIGKRVTEVLGSSKQELRIEAARWLVRLDYRAAIPALYAALDKETREPVSAELMTALERLGEDIGPRLAPEALLKQARKGLKARPPAGLAWLNLDGMPACTWANASGPDAVVDPDIIRWWVILAAKLKEPAANALLVRYLGLLEPASRAALGRFLLHQFIARDTANPPLEEAIAYAKQHAPGRYQDYQQAAKRYPEYYAEQGKLTEEQVFEEAKREKLSEYTGTAINEKGILALTCAAPGHELADAIRLYMRDHYVRRAQVEAMLEAASVSDDPAVIQFILSISRRYRTASVQQKARLLVERIAERNGWTQDQLADRTVPTGGLDESGRMTFAYGARSFTVVLDEKLKPVLHNADGKPLAALPAPRQNDTPESIKEGKALFTTCKKEVKQVVDMQSARLYEAMCAGRRWPVADWDEYLRRHPVVGRLVQRLVWMRFDADGQLLGLLRPTEDGSLIDAADDEIELGPDGQIGLAHASLLGDDQVKAWQAHFKDYKLTPLFAQLARRAPPKAVMEADPTAEGIADRLGWISDTFTLRGAFGKLGYARGSAEDGGVFFEYVKDFSSLGIQVRIEFSGSALPEENMPAALKTLGFVRFGTGVHGSLPLSKVPPVLLAEAYGDYHAVAAACQGFDPEWERKMPW